MQLKVPVSIDMVERQSGRPIGRKLRGDFDSELTFHRWVERDLHAVAGKVAANLPPRSTVPGILAGSLTGSPSRRTT